MHLWGLGVNVEVEQKEQVSNMILRREWSLEQKDDGLLGVHKSGGQILTTLNELHLNKLSQA